MSGLSLLPVFLIGLLGGVHCVGMCGGIVSAFALAAPARPFPVPVTAAMSPALQSAGNGLLRVLSYNTGRIASYMAAGALAGGLAGGANFLSGMTALQAGGYWLANGMLVVLGLYLAGVWSGLARLEALGQGAWRRVRPAMQFLLPVDSAPKALALGALWGWVPCGMVYSVLLTAMLTGDAASGALVMLVFGLGTLPTLITLGLLGDRLRQWVRLRSVRLACGALVLGFGLLGLARAAGGMGPAWLDIFCVSPQHAEAR